VQALRDRFEIVAGEAAVGRKALGQHEEVAALLGRHRAGARIGQEIDEDVLGAQPEDVEWREAKRLETLLAGRLLEGLDRLIRNGSMIVRNGSIWRFPECGADDGRGGDGAA
jgi:hypothetical protein